MSKNIGASNVEPETPRVISSFRGKPVDREEQLAKFSDVLERISRQGTVSSNLFEWYGSPGIGKSMLVEMLADRADKKQAAWSIVNFKQPEEKTEAYLRDPIVLVEPPDAAFLNDPGPALHGAPRAVSMAVAE